jgi:hypothetical protein
MKRSQNLTTILVCCLLLCCAATQFQVTLVRGLGAVNGSFGLRPLSHDCLGLEIAGEKLAWLPDGEWDARIILFTLRYALPADPSGRTYCLGQDLWYGE